MLLSTTAAVFAVIVVLEVTIIVTANVFTIFVFWTQRLHWKRTYLLLINLAVADLIVGLVEALVLAASTIPNGGNEAEKRKSPFWAFQVFGSCTSVLFLVSISLERVYSVLWPYRHCVTSTRAYVYSILILWVVGVCMSAVSLLAIYLIDNMYADVIYASALFFSLVVICTSYLMIRLRLRSTAPNSDSVQMQATRERSLRMSRTVFIVVAVSLVFWFPAFVMVTTQDFCSCFPPLAVWFVIVLQLGNSMVNPFVYSFRMPIFQDALKKCWRKCRQTIELSAFSPRQSHNAECNL